MVSHLFAHPLVLVGGFITGSLIGFILQKGRISQFKTMIGQFLFKDFTLLKMMLTAIIVGAVTVRLLISANIAAAFPIEPWSILATITGGLLIGVGIATLGYCPGTCAAAAGQGSNDAWWGLLGMVLGGAFYSEIHLIMKKKIHTVWILITKPTLADVFGVSSWIIIAILSVGAIILFWMLEKKSGTLNPDPPTPQDPLK